MDPLPPHTIPRSVRSLSSRNLAIVGLVCCWLAGILTLALAIDVWTWRTMYFTWTVNQSTKVYLPLATNVVVTLCNEAAGYIHTVSLRWALQREGRLEFSSNLRLLTSARTSKANAWYTNSFMIICIIISYTSTTMLLLDEMPFSSGSQRAGVIIESLAHLILGIAMVGQAAVATVALRASKGVPSWSSSPIDIAAACLSIRSLEYEPKRGLCSAHDQQAPDSPMIPRKRQRSCFSLSRTVRFLFYFFWVTVALTALWGGIMTALTVSKHVAGGSWGTSWALIPAHVLKPTVVDGSPLASALASSSTMTFIIPWCVYLKDQSCWPSSARFVGAFFLACVLQAIITLSLHCAELQINLIRDELTWRRAGSKGYTRSPKSAFFAAATSLPAIVLFVFKPVVHWLFGLAFSVYWTWGVLIHPPQIFYLAIALSILAFFLTACVFWQPSGPQPATYGHLQTIVNLVDDWPAEGETMYWGRKMNESSTQTTLFDADKSMNVPEHVQLTRHSVFDWETEQTHVKDTIASNVNNAMLISDELKIVRVIESQLKSDKEISSRTWSKELAENRPQEALSFEGKAVAHAGTASFPLDSIQFSEVYI